MSQVEDECDRFIRSLRGDVVTLGVPGHAHPFHTGLPDRRYRYRLTRRWGDPRGAERTKGKGVPTQFVENKDLTDFTTENEI